MSTPLAISTLIESAVNNIDDLVFMRATDAEANVMLDDIDLASSSVAIYNNRPETIGTVQDTSGVMETEWPIEIVVVGLADFDDNDQDSDIISDPLYTIAQELYDRITSDTNQSKLTPAGAQAIDLGEPVKLYDKTLTGVKLSFSVFYSRGIKCY